MSVATNVSSDFLRNPRFVRSVLDVNGMLSLGKMQNARLLHGPFFATDDQLGRSVVYIGGTLDT